MLTTACATLQPPDAGGPGAAGPPYPPVSVEQPQRREAAVLALNRIVPRNGSVEPATAYLQPITATIRNLPTNLAAPLVLPKVGGGAEMTEAETREALRRFINDWRDLIGANPAQLSLVERIDQPDRTRIAAYEQRAFRYPLRGDYGKLEIRFTTDRRLLNVSSSCIPDAERLQASLANITPRVKPEDAIGRLRNSDLEYFDSLGTKHNYRLSASNEIQPAELVTYALVSKSSPGSLKLHITWEIGVTNAPFKNIYVDAFNDEVIAAR
ncbi:MAG: hypothetical protein ACREBG_17255 [Pyrinomonadaceae bacterium]